MMTKIGLSMFLFVFIGSMAIILYVTEIQDEGKADSDVHAEAEERIGKDYNLYTLGGNVLSGKVVQNKRPSLVQLLKKHSPALWTATEQDESTAENDRNMEEMPAEEKEKEEEEAEKVEVDTATEKEDEGSIDWELW
jgi:hypothetical protein